ncbi:hypothetical protein [Candidatus Odyssella thessalonicensis]|uniref:hypothetical protein n=1 Tax=Candidatus Odyssella thessalonicensis TaxID=84647 RepID=UPI000225AF28|nr:hypothetical protein [Candidatus Odyssella thessalonicensis]
MFYQSMIVALALLFTSDSRCLDVTTQIPLQDIERVQKHYQAYLSLSQQQKGTMDVHAFNRTLNMRQVLADLYQFDNKYLYSDPNFAPDLIAESILWCREFEDLSPQAQQSVRQNLTILRNHFSHSPVESAETGANVKELLSRIWYLSSFEERRAPGNIFETSSAARQFLLHSLRENSETGGGCYPGFAGRLASLYLMLINSWIIG